jgi:hypothetical protein
VRNDLLDHWRESYVCETKQSMKRERVGETPEGSVVAKTRHGTH